MAFYQFSKQFQNKYGCLGFVKIKKTFARIVNDVLQTFTFIEKRKVCSIEFGVFPLCMDIKRADIGLYRLDKFSPEIIASYGGWIYNKCSKQSKYDCASAMINVVDRELIPFFLKADCCTSALHELIKLDELFDANRKKALYILGWEDCAKPWQEASLSAPEKYYMALKSHNFQYALQYIEHMCAWHNSVLQTKNDPNSQKQPDIVYERFEAGLRKLNEHKRRIEIDDTAFFDSLVQENEKRSLVHLSNESTKLIVLDL